MSVCEFMYVNEIGGGGGGGEVKEEEERMKRRMVQGREKLAEVHSGEERETGRTGEREGRRGGWEGAEGRRQVSEVCGKVVIIRVFVT